MPRLASGVGVCIQRPTAGRARTAGRRRGCCPQTRQWACLPPGVTRASIDAAED